MLGLQFRTKLDATSPGLNLLFICAHCDDIEIGCGGSILRLLQEHSIAHVKWIVLSSNPIRAIEAKNCAAAFLGSVESKEIRICDFKDGFLSQQYTEVK